MMSHLLICFFWLSSLFRVLKRGIWHTSVMLSIRKNEESSVCLSLNRVCWWVCLLCCVVAWTCYFSAVKSCYPQPGGLSMAPLSPPTHPPITLFRVAVVSLLFLRRCLTSDCSLFITSAHSPPPLALPPLRPPSPIDWRAGAVKSL